MAKSLLVQARINPRDPDRPEDRQALEVFNAWRDAGWSERDILIKGLLALGGKTIQTMPADKTAKRLQSLVNQLEEIVEAMPQLQAMKRGEAVYTSGERAGEQVNWGPLDTILGSLAPPAYDNSD